MSDLPTRNLPFVDLKAQRDRIAGEINSAIDAVLNHAAFINGPEISKFEQELAFRSNCADVVACASGTDALVLALAVSGIGYGDVVFVPSFTFVATVEAVTIVGATPFFCDVNADDFNLSPDSVELAIGVCKRENLGVPRAIIPVDLFGQPADYKSFSALAEKYDLTVIADAAQSYGAGSNDVPVGALAPLTTTSFFPAKPLGCYGDGGAVLDLSGRHGEALRSLREHGQAREKYKYERIGYNARMDTIQAAILLAKLKIFDDELLARSRVAERYTARLHDVVSTPAVSSGNTSAWAQYTVRVADREQLAVMLRTKGIPTAVYYPAPIHVQEPYRHFPSAPEGLPATAELSRTVLSLPMHPYLSEADQTMICDSVIAHVRAGS